MSDLMNARFKSVPDAAEEAIAGVFNKAVWTKFNKGIREYSLINNGDRIAVCISGGKDSMLLAKCMQRLERFGKTSFEAVFLAMDAGFTDEVRENILENCRRLHIPVEMHNTNVFDSVQKSSGNPCFLCSRLRRGWLYKTAMQLGCNKIALGHHFDDVIETILMGMLYGSQMQTMMPKLHSENYSGMQVIRPLYLVREEDIIKWQEYCGLNFSQCACRIAEKNSSGGNSSKRYEIKKLLNELRKSNPSVDMNIFRSAENVNLRTLISYHDGENYHSFLDDYDEGITVKGTKNQKYI